MKVVIPAAGIGSRFLPATKSQPKEMLPVVDRPVIQYVVEEAVAGGADDILIITGRGKRAIEDHFDLNPELGALASRPEIRAVDELALRAKIHFVRQRDARGLADAIGLARHHTGREPFGVLLGDTINVCDPPLLRQLWTRYETLQGPVIAVEQVPDEKVDHYGIVEGPQVSPGVVRCEKLVEKPRPDQTPSRLGITGAYVLTPDIYECIDATPPGVGGEIQITDALQLLARKRPVYAARFSGVRYDIGDRYFWLKANLEFAFRDPTLREQLRPVMDRLLKDGSSRPEGSVPGL